MLTFDYKLHTLEDINVYTYDLHMLTNKETTMLQNPTDSQLTSRYDDPMDDRAEGYVAEKTAQGICDRIDTMLVPVLDHVRAGFLLSSSQVYNHPITMVYSEHLPDMYKKDGMIAHGWWWHIIRAHKAELLHQEVPHIGEPIKEQNKKFLDLVGMDQAGLSLYFSFTAIHGTLKHKEFLYRLLKLLLGYYGGDWAQRTDVDQDFMQNYIDAVEQTIDQYCDISGLAYQDLI